MNANQPAEKVKIPEVLLETAPPADDLSSTTVCCPVRDSTLGSSTDNKSPSPTVPTGNEAYRQALRNFSARHAPEVDKSFPMLSILVDVPKSPSPVNNLINNLNRITRKPVHAQEPASVTPTRWTPSLESNVSPLDAFPKAKSPSSAECRLSSPSPVQKRIQKLVCIDPEMHSAESHAKFHHPGLLKGADFCDSGADDTSDAPIQLSDKPWHLLPFDDKENDSEDEEPIIGRMYRALTGGDICEELVDVSGHHGVSKVGQLVQLPPFKYPEGLVGASYKVPDKLPPLVEQNGAKGDMPNPRLPSSDRLQDMGGNT
ncbi:hypothetical protein B0T17DRAFT_612479 [Bombardia bombarda]|uniref:Uncharacterized protein n=1 Tax=Bombardia bombarda TaxID=252184 RepID=A0AA40CFL4_9PEZI|nr:hypothetical protein B0T17DRAFT_612479 [Bombardia bombarda]